MAVYTYGAVTDRGDFREENQDSILCVDGDVEGKETALFAVADGMGGLSWGGQVSRYIAERFACWWNEDFPDMVRAGRDSSADIRELLEQEIWDINQAVLQFRKKEHCSCGSTLSLLLLYGNRYFIENIGDSRVYLYRRGSLKRLTEDQSLVAQLVREGKMTEEEARRSSKKNKLTMCIGMFEIPQSYFVTGEWKPGDVFLLCSDGLYNPLLEEQLEQVLARGELSAGERAQLLRNSVLPGDGRDNISAIVAEVLGK